MKVRLFVASLCVAGFAMTGFVSAQPNACNGHSCNTTNNNMSNSFSASNSNSNSFSPTNTNTNVNAVMNRAVSRGNTTSVSSGNVTTGPTSVTTGPTSMSTGANNMTSSYSGSYSGGKTVINAQPAYAPDLSAIAPTAPCLTAVTASAGGGGIFSIGAGFTTKDQDCEKRAYAQSLAALGKDKAALAILCQTDYVAAAMTAVGEVCPGSIPVAAASARTSVSANSVAPNSAVVRNPTFAPYSSGSGYQPHPVFGG